MYPLPSEFISEISQSGSKSRFSAVDPVCYPAPRELWSGTGVFSTNSFFQGTVEAHTVPTAPPNLGNATNRTVVMISIPRGAPNPVGFSANQTLNYYSGCVIEFDIGSGVYEYERILEWRYLYTNATPADIFQVTLYNQVSNLAITTPRTIRIKDPSVYNGAANINLNIYIPNGVSSNNYYIDYYIYNQTRREWLKIYYYSGSTHVATVNTNNITRYTPGTWLPTDTYILRKEIPSEVGVIGIVTTQQIFRISPGSSSIDDYYVGSYIRIEGTSKESKRITQYIASTQTATIESAFTVPVAPGNFYEILPYSRDNEYPIDYSGSLVSHREAVCYDVELLNLVLPNTTLNVGSGSRAIFYPFVYVELTPISNSERQGPNSITSNNPNARRMLFRALVFDTTNELNSPFVRIDGGGMVQRIKLLPNDNFKFSVHLPDGTLFDTELPEYYAPDIPNNLKQISALFALKRVQSS